MSLSEREIQEIVRAVVSKVETGTGSAGTGSERSEVPVPAVSGNDGVFSRMSDAVEAAHEAQKRWIALPIETRKRCIEAMRAMHVAKARDYAEMAVSETGLGRVEDKIQKNLVAATRTQGMEDIPHTVYSGDHGITLEEYVPYGVIGSITPTTNPTETIVNNAIMMVAAGNAVVFNAHPSAKRVSMTALSNLNKAIVAAGGPPYLLTGIPNPTIETGNEMMKHPKVAAITVTGGGGVVKAALAAGKRAMTAGPGNPPVLVDDTANLDRAGREVVRGASIDNCVICTAEKECFVFDSVADDLKKSLRKHGGHELNGHQTDQLCRKVLDGYQGARGPNRLRPNKSCVGRDASVLAKMIDLTIPSDTRLLFAEVDSKDHPLVQTEQLMPFLPIVRVPDFEAGVAAALDAEHGYRHTAVIHSNDLDRITRYAKAMNCSILVANGPNFAGLGLDGEGPTAWTITTPTGEGCTTPRNFCRKRRFTVKDALRIY